MTIKVNFKDLPKTHTPVLNHCRKLIKEGVDPSERLEVYRTQDDPDVIVPNIGKAALLSVSESPSPSFCKYKPFIPFKTGEKRMTSAR